MSDTENKNAPTGADEPTSTESEGQGCHSTIAGMFAFGPDMHTIVKWSLLAISVCLCCTGNCFCGMSKGTEADPQKNIAKTEGSLACCLVGLVLLLISCGVGYCAMFALCSDMWLNDEEVVVAQGDDTESEGSAAPAAAQEGGEDLGSAVDLAEA